MHESYPSAAKELILQSENFGFVGSIHHDSGVVTKQDQNLKKSQR